MKHAPDDPELTVGRGRAPTTERLPLFDSVSRARLTDPPTSHAAVPTVDHVAAQHTAIVQALDETGPLTADEIDAALGWRPTTAGRRMRELWAAGRVRSTGETRRTRSGKAAEVWSLTP